MTDTEIFFYSLALVVLLILAAFFSCAETGLMAVNRYRLRHKARLKKRYAIRLLQMLNRPDRVLGAILIGSTFANMFVSSLGTLLAYHFWGDKGALIATMLLAVIVLIFAEIAPKTLAALYPDRVAQWVGFAIQVVMKILYPIVWLANSVTNGLLRLMRVRVESSGIEPLTRDELRSVVYDTTGKISRQYQNMLLSVLDLNKLTVDDVMIPRHEIIGIDIQQPWDKIFEQITKLQAEWIPVYRENVNQIIGILYTREILRLCLADHNINKEILQQVLHEPYYVPAGTALYTQLIYFQQNKDKIAFVVDEYGEIEGLLTLNDILEEIVGDFTSSIALGKRIQKQPDGSYLVSGGMTVREFNRLTEMELPLGGPRTINGLVIEYLEALPRASTAVLIAHHPIEIVQVKENRVKLARIYPKLKHKYKPA